MTHLAPLAALLAMLTFAACDKPAPEGDPQPATSAKSAPEPAKPATPAAEPPERVKATGVLDLELVTKGRQHTLRNPTFALTFPTRPSVQSQQDRVPDGGLVTSGMAVANHGADQYAFVVTPIPKDLAYDAHAGIEGARDGAMRAVNAKVKSEVDSELGGLASRKISATAVDGGRTIYVDLHLAWDEPHHQLIMLLTASPNATPSKAATDFVASLEVKADTAAAPPATP